MSSVSLQTSRLLARSSLGRVARPPSLSRSLSSLLISSRSSSSPLLRSTGSARLALPHVQPSSALFPALVRAYASDSYPPHKIIDMPALSPTMTQGNLGTWQKAVGDEITPGDILVEIETDKAQMDFECQEEGYIAKILVDSGSKDVDVKTPIAVLVEDEADVEKFANFTASSSSSGASEAPKEEAPKPEAPKESSSSPAPSKPAESSSSSSSDRIIASPLAKNLAKEKNIDLSQVKGSGPGGRITKQDVLSFTPSTSAATSSAAPSAPPAAAPAPADSATYTDIPLTNVRKVIASRLSEAKQTIPHYYLTAEINMDNILKLRKALNSMEGATKLSVNDFIVKASALALQKVPEVNSAWQGDFIRQYRHSDICVATATPGGLITPIVHQVEAKGLSTISSQIKSLVSRARENALKPHEYQGGSFTISNLGMFGVSHFTAIINPPQSCILAVGTSEDKLIADPSSDRGFRSTSVMRVTLSCDHRVVDGAVGSQWLNAFKGFMENPLTFLL